MTSVGSGEPRSRSDGIFDVSPAAMPWRVGIDDLRREVRGNVPRLTSRRVAPPIGRTAVVAATLGGAIAQWRVARRGMSRTESRHDLSVRLRGAAERLGPTFVKLAQIIASGEGVFPDELVNELAKLRDQVAPEPFEWVQEVIATEFGRPLSEVFADISPEPIAAASIAQVHAATLIDGTEVVVKVQRRGITERVYQDLAALSWLAPLLVGRIPVAALANPPVLVEVFAQSIVEELDFRLEADNMIDVAEALRLLEIDGFVVPRPHPRLVTEKVLVMERVDGLTFDRVIAAQEAGTYAYEIDRKEIVRSWMLGMLEGAFIAGIFHGDLHPGNLLVRPDGTTALVDYGIVGRLSEPKRAAFVRMLVASTTGDIPGQVAAVRDIGALPADTDIDSVIVDLGLDQEAVDPTSLSRGELVAEMNRIVKALLGYGASMPRELMLFAKNMVFLDGAITQLTPDLDLLGEIRYISMFFARKHANQLAADAGVKFRGDQVDLSAIKGQFGLDPSTEEITWRELKERRELITRRLAGRE